MKRISEAAFETAIDGVLLANSYAQVGEKGCGRERAHFLKIGPTQSSPARSC